MIGKSERYSAEFLNWEYRGRGFQVWDFPVTPEPLFSPFPGHGSLIGGSVADDGRKPTFLSTLMRKLSERLAEPDVPDLADDADADKSPKKLSRTRIVELQAHLPSKLRFDSGVWEDFFVSVRGCREPVAFEILATRGRMQAQFAVHPGDVALVVQQLEAFFPDVAFVSISGALRDAWGEVGQSHAQAVEFGLGKEFVIPISAPRIDPFVGLAGALGGVDHGEVAVFQVIYAPSFSPWSENIIRSVAHADGSAFFVNAPELLPGAKAKVEMPLFGAVVRLAAKTADSSRTWELLCDAAAALGVYGSTNGNELIPLESDGYLPELHEEDVLLRQTHRSGMLLNASELAGFVHLPSEDVRAPALRRKERKTKAAPPILLGGAGLVIGNNIHREVEKLVSLTDDQRARHVHVIGASGTGKSTLLFNLIMQDIERGDGITVLEPHGDLIDRILGSIPENRIDDVVLLDLSDEERIVGFNILSAHSDWEKNLLASDLVSVFRRLSSAWGDQLNSVLHNALLAFLKCEKGGTLLDLRRFLLEPGFRAEVLKTVRDSNVVYYWQKAFPQLSGNKSVGSVITRLDTFLSPEAIRFMVAQRENRLDFGDIMNSGKIFLAKLSQGAIGKDNSHLLGSLIVAKLQSEAMARQQQSEASRRYHWAYIDEFHDFLTPSLADSLSGVRKYRLGLTLSHQEMRQVEREPDVASALLSNAYTRIVFRVGDKDARTMEGGFSAFEAKDIQNLGTGEAICRVERSEFDFNITVPFRSELGANETTKMRERVIAASRAKYSIPCENIESRVELPAEKSRPEAVEEAKKTAKGPEMMTPPASKSDSLLNAEKPKPTTVLPDLGKGGAQHKAIQDRIKEEGERLGFRVVVEHDVAELGQIDLVLTRVGVSIACEVTVTGTIDYEVGNVSKCIKAGFERIAVVGVSEDKLGKLASAVANSLGSEKAGRVSYYLPDAFIAALATVTKPIPAAEPVTRTRGGRVVKRALIAPSPEEAKAKEEQAIKLMAELMKKKKRL